MSLLKVILFLIGLKKSVMKRLLLLIFGLTLAFVLPAQVVINEVYGGGGNTGARIQTILSNSTTTGICR